MCQHLEYQGHWIGQMRWLVGLQMELEHFSLLSSSSSEAHASQFLLAHPSVFELLTEWAQLTWKESILSYWVGRPQLSLLPLVIKKDPQFPSSIVRSRRLFAGRTKKLSYNSASLFFLSSLFIFIRFLGLGLRAGILVSISSLLNFSLLIGFDKLRGRRWTIFVLPFVFLWKIKS